MRANEPKHSEKGLSTSAIKAEQERIDRERRAAAIQKAERERIDQVRQAAKNPATCSDQIPKAPARGPVSEFKEFTFLPKGDEFTVVEVPYRSGCPGRVRDVFDEMTDQAGRRGGVPLFTVAQVGAARDYRELHERLQSAGIKCSTAFNASKQGGGSRRDFMDVYMGDAHRMAWFGRAIGNGVALEPRGGNAADRRRKPITATRKVITVARLVEMVCIGQRPLSAVLVVHGWSASSKNRALLRDALCSALTRMQGI